MARPRKQRAEGETEESPAARKGPSEYDLRSPRGGFGSGVLTQGEGAIHQQDPLVVPDPDERDAAYLEKRSGFASDPEAEVANPDKKNKLAGVSTVEQETPFEGNFYLPAQRQVDNEGPNPTAVVTRPYGSEPGNLNTETGLELPLTRPLEDGPRDAA